MLRLKVLIYNHNILDSPSHRRFLMPFSLYGLGNFRTQDAAINYVLLSFNISELYLHDKETLSKVCVWFTVSGTKESDSAVKNL